MSKTGSDHVSDSHLIYFTIEFHHFRWLHKFLLKRAPDSLPVFPLPAISVKSTFSLFILSIKHFCLRCELRPNESEEGQKSTYRMRSPYASFLRSL